MFEEALNAIKQKLTDLANWYKQLRGEKQEQLQNPINNNKTPENTAPQNPLPQPKPEPQKIVGNNPIKQSVGDTNGVNDPADVITIQQLLIDKGYSSVKATGTCDDATKAAIRDYQKTKMGNKKPDGRVDPNGNTWKSLNGQAPTNYTGSTAKYRPQDQQNDDWETETEREKKMEEFFDNFTHIKVRINPGVEPPQFVEVVPSYEINSVRKKDPQGKELPEPLKLEKWADIYVTGKAGAIRKKLPWHARAGKATAPDITWYLNECVKQGAVSSSQMTPKGFRKFLDDTCVGVDCTGLVAQALNFLVDGNMDFDKKTDDVNIGNGLDTSKNNYTPVASPAQLKAGDVMKLEKTATGTYGHVRIVVDVDAMPDGSIYVRTIESGGGGESSGVGHVLWRYKNPATFDGLERSDDNGTSWKSSDEHKSRQMKYIRWDKLATVPE